MSKTRLIIMLLLAQIGVSLPACAAASPIQTGWYEGTLIGYDADSQRVTGYFRQSTGNGQFNCIFYFDGLLQGNGATIDSFFPKTPQEDLIHGRLTFVDSKDILITLEEEHGGCWNATPFAFKGQGADLSLIKPYAWQAVQVVKSAKAYLYDQPAAATHRKAYLVKGDGVGIRARQDGWVNIDFVTGQKPVSGWMRAEDFYVLP